MKRLNSYIGVFLLALFCCYFYSINMCFHTHVIDGVLICHSHPYSHSHSHSHSQAALHTIDILTVFQSGDVIPGDIHTESRYFLLCEISTPLHFADVEDSSSDSRCLRAPPAWYA